MMPHPAFLVGGAVLGAALALLLAYREWEQQQQQRHRRQHRPGPDYRVDRDPDSARPVVIGNCTHCEGDVTALSGHRLPCNHFIHFTCEFTVTRRCRNTLIDWSELCRECAQSRVAERRRAELHERGLRLRALMFAKQSSSNCQQKRRATPVKKNNQTCPDCRLCFANDEESRFMACGHKVHEKCWQEMETSGYTSCSICMEEF